MKRRYNYTAWLFSVAMMAVCCLVGCFPHVSMAQDSIAAPIYAAPQTLDAITDSVVILGYSDEYIDSLKQSRDFAYANDPEYWRKEPSRNNGFLDSLYRVLTSPATRLLFYAFLVCIAIFVIYRIFAANGIWRSLSRKQADESGTDLNEQRPDIENQLETAIKAGNFRNAIRLHHLKMLYCLNDNNLITYDPQSVNDIYRSQLKGSSYYPDFNFLTRIYEYAWYGEFQVSADQYKRAAEGFNNFINKLPC